jgi:hypothetical protein
MNMTAKQKAVVITELAILQSLAMKECIMHENEAERYRGLHRKISEQIVKVAAEKVARTAKKL